MHLPYDKVDNDPAKEEGAQKSPLVVVIVMIIMLMDTVEKLPRLMEIRKMNPSKTPEGIGSMDPPPMSGLGKLTRLKMTWKFKPECLPGH